MASQSAAGWSYDRSRAVRPWEVNPLRMAVAIQAVIVAAAAAASDATRAAIIAGCFLLANGVLTVLLTWFLSERFGYERRRRRSKRRRAPVRRRPPD